MRLYHLKHDTVPLRLRILVVITTFLYRWTLGSVVVLTSMILIIQYQRPAIVS